MEQKTEASQAVDLPVLPHLPRAVGYRHTMDNTEGIKGNKPQIYFSSTKPAPFGIPGLDYSASFPVTTEALFTADQMKEYARAALKAQPAPTEAAAVAFGEPFDPKDETIKRLQGLVDGFIQIEKSRAKIVAMRERLGMAPEVLTEAAQGEGSARLDAQVTAAARVLANRSADACGVNREDNWNIYSQDFIDDARAVLEAARASAETGGVKS